MATAIRAGTLIDGTGAGPVRNATVLIEGTTITAVNANGDVPRDAEVIDATGMTVMPGIDCHVHLPFSAVSVSGG
jgi:imidazolonepropionase-like amidohydrolase